MKRSIFLLLALTFALSANLAQAGGLTEEKITAAQQSWAEGIVAIGQAKIDGKDYQETAKQLIDSLYGYESGTVLFKPTKAAEDQFRQTFAEAHSYFVKGKIEEDGGFAINPWTNVRFENHNMIIEGNIALAMGNYYFTTTSGDEVKVEYTFGYRLGEDGQPRIVLHHSSLPYSS